MPHVQGHLDKKIGFTIYGFEIDESTNWSDPIFNKDRVELFNLLEGWYLLGWAISWSWYAIRKGYNLFNKSISTYFSQW